MHGWGPTNTPGAHGVLPIIPELGRERIAWVRLPSYTNLSWELWIQVRDPTHKILQRAIQESSHQPHVFTCILTHMHTCLRACMIEYIDTHAHKPHTHTHTNHTQINMQKTIKLQKTEEGVIMQYYINICPGEGPDRKLLIILMKPAS